MDKRIHTAAALQEQAERRARLLAPSQPTSHIDVIAEWRGRVKPGHVNILRFHRFAELTDWTFNGNEAKWENNLDERVFRGHKLLCNPYVYDTFVRQIYVGDVKALVYGHSMPFAMFSETAIGIVLQLPTKITGQSLCLHVTTKEERRVKIHFIGYMLSEVS